LYHLVGALMADQLEPEARKQYEGVLRAELSANVHGEVDEESWHLKRRCRAPSSLRKRLPF